MIAVKQKTEYGQVPVALKLDDFIRTLGKIPG